MPLDTLLTGGRGAECNTSWLQENWLEMWGVFPPNMSRNSSANMKYVLLQTPVLEGLHHKITLRGFAQSICICTDRTHILGRKEQLPNKTLGIFFVCSTCNLGIHFLLKNHYLGVEGDKIKNRSHSNPVCITY